MYTVWILQHEFLYREICFKPVIGWIEDALAAFHIARAAILPDVDTLPRDPSDQEIILTKPVIFSPLLTGGHEHVRWPGGEVPIPWGCMPVSTPEELCKARSRMKEAILAHHTANGVDIIDPATTFLGPDVTIGRGTTILPGVVARGRVSIGEGCEVGPFTHIRPGVDMGNEVKAGAFVELKNTVMGDGSHAGHLCYLGDTDAGKNVNFGCGTVTVNYDGADKARTKVDDDAFIGCNTNLVAPVTIGRGAYTAAGSTITEDVPPYALAIARQRQVIKTDWTSPKNREQKTEDENAAPPVPP